ncbi:MAG: RluA family pseudouridine synthase [Polyangiaceae bacterium]
MKIVIDAEQATTRLDKVIVEATGLGRAAVKRLFDSDRVRVGKRVAQKGELVPEGREVTIDMPEAPPAGPPPAAPEIDLVVLLERADLLVINKSAGIPTAPLKAGESGTVVNALLARYPEIAGVGFTSLEPGLVHRLDNGTSGVLVVARTSSAFDGLVAALKRGEIEKEYLAICEDQGLSDSGTLDIPLAPHPKDGRRVLACLHPRDVSRFKPRPAVTDYQVIRRAGGLALVSLHAPKALRHQIRAHLSAVGCPIVGDVLYGAEEREGLDRHALHASSVRWRGDERVAAFSAKAELPEELAKLMPA